MTHASRWVKIEISYGLADYLLGRDAVETVKAWICDVLSELYESWPAETPGYVRKRSVLDQTHHAGPRAAGPSHAAPSALRPETAHTTRRLSLQVDGDIEGRGLNNFLESQHQIIGEVRQATTMRYKG